MAAAAVPAFLVGSPDCFTQWSEVLLALEGLSGTSPSEMKKLRGGVRATLVYAAQQFGTPRDGEKERALHLLQGSADFDGTASVWLAKFAALHDHLRSHPVDLQRLCTSLSGRGCAHCAARIVTSCGGYGLIECGVLVCAMVEREQVDDALTFAASAPAEYEGLRALVVRQACAAGRSKLAAKAIGRFNLDWRAFPVVVRARALDTLRWRHHAGHFELAEALLEEFPELRDEYSALLARKPRVDAAPPAAPPSAGYCALLAGSTVTLVEDVATLEAAVEHALSLRFAGIDAEWTPPATMFTEPNCALLQLAAGGDSRAVYLIDLLALRAAREEEVLRTALALRRLLFDDTAGVGAGAGAAGAEVGEAAAGTTTMLVGFALRGDYDQLKRAWPEVGWDGPRRGIVDLSREVGKKKQKKKNAGLSDLCQRVLGQPLDKRERMSNWSARPLRPAQVVYAALDAQVLLTVQSRLQ